MKKLTFSWPWKGESVTEGSPLELRLKHRFSRPANESRLGGLTFRFVLVVLAIAVVLSGVLYRAAFSPQVSEAAGTPAQSGSANASPSTAPASANAGSPAGVPYVIPWPSGLPTATATMGPNSGPFSNLYDNGCTVVRGDPDRARLVAEAKAIAKPLVKEWFGDAHWPALVELWQHESEWYPKACNPKSRACGLTQALPCKKMQDRTTRGQVLWGLDYIARKYGDPHNAWVFWQCKESCPKYPGGPILKKGKKPEDPKSNWY